MLHLYNRATIAHALTLDLDPRLRELLAQRIGALATEYGDLTDHTEFLVVDDPADTEDRVVAILGFSPLVDPFSGARFGESGFAIASWNFCADRHGYLECIFTFGSTFACVLLIKDAPGIWTEARAMCRAFPGVP